MKLAAGSRIAAARVRRSQPPWPERVKGFAQPDRRSAPRAQYIRRRVCPASSCSPLSLTSPCLLSSRRFFTPTLFPHVPFFSTACTPIERSPAPPRPAE